MNDRSARDAALNDPAFLELIAAWHDNLELSAERQAELLARLRDDPALRRHLAEQIGFDGLVRAVQAPEARWLKLEDRLGPDPDRDTAMEDAVMAAIAGERSLAADQRAGNHRSSRSRLWSPRLFAAALAVGLVIAGGIAFVAIQRRGKTEDWPAARRKYFETLADEIRKKAAVKIAGKVTRQIERSLAGYDRLRRALVERVEARLRSTEPPPVSDMLSVETSTGPQGQRIQRRVRRRDPIVDSKFIDSILKEETALLRSLLNGPENDSKEQPPGLLTLE
jgi:hypothetical protein